MTPRPTADSSAVLEQVLPDYGSSSLADLMPAIGAHLGVPGCEADPLRLAGAQRYVVVLVDGLGFHLVRRSLARAPYLASLLGEATAMTCGVPSTTATSLASLGTGLVPAQHGLVGYTSRVPATGAILNALDWDRALSARNYQRKPTLFERAAASGVAVTSVGSKRFAGSGLTEAALRGADFLGLEHESDEERWIELVVDAAGRGERSLVYAYERELDHTGHVLGCESPQWLSQLSRIDASCERLRNALPDDVRLIITGDHGMVDVPRRCRLVAENEPELMAGLAALAGEGRFRQLYVEQHQTAAVARRWSDRLGETAWVRTRDEAMAEGWFGRPDPALYERYGHVLVAMRGRHAVMTQQYPREAELVGMHGSLTPDEMVVPLFCD